MMSRNSCPGFDLVIVPSRQEPLSRVLIESLAAGVPCLASKVGGNEEIIIDGRFGRCCSSDNAQELVQYAMAILNDSELIERTRREASSFVAERFSPERQVSQILEIYHSLLSGG